MELPDVNVLIALFDPAHVHHEPSQAWFTAAALFDLVAVQGHRQVTDLYLLGLCQRHGGTLVTFDSSLPAVIRAVVGARDDLLRVLAG